MNSVYTIIAGAVPGKRSSCESSTGILAVVSWAATELVCTGR